MLLWPSKSCTSSMAAPFSAGFCSTTAQTPWQLWPTIRTVRCSRRSPGQGVGCRSSLASQYDPHDDQTVRREGGCPGAPAWSPGHWGALAAEDGHHRRHRPRGRSTRCADLGGSQLDYDDCMGDPDTRAKHRTCRHGRMSRYYLCAWIQCSMRSLMDSSMLQETYPTEQGPSDRRIWYSRCSGTMSYWVQGKCLSSTLTKQSSPSPRRSCYWA